MPTLKNHSIVHKDNGEIIIVNDITGLPVGDANAILNSPNAEEICKDIVHRNTKSETINHLDPLLGSATITHGYRYYVDDETQSKLAKNFYLFANTAKESLESFIKALKKEYEHQNN